MSLALFALIKILMLLSMLGFILDFFKQIYIK